MDNQFLTLTYLDNEALEKAVVKSIESRKLNKNWWQVYGLGQLGEVEGRIYTGWNIIDSVPKFPESPRLWRYGMDFGYTNDPTAIIAIYEYNNGYILDEKVYQKGMRNKEIADTMKNFDRALTIADSAEPKSIDEIRSYGINIIPSEKGRDSIVHGITYIQDQKISVTKRSVNLIREYRNYMWQESRDGSRMENEPSDVLNHALDAIRYAIANKKAHKWVAPTDFGGVKPLFHGMPG